MKLLRTVLNLFSKAQDCSASCFNAYQESKHEMKYCFKANMEFENEWNKLPGWMKKFLIKWRWSHTEDKE